MFEEGWDRVDGISLARSVRGLAKQAHDVSARPTMMRGSLRFTRRSGGSKRDGIRKLPPIWSDGWPAFDRLWKTGCRWAS